MVLVDTSVWIDFFRGEMSRETDSLAEMIESSQDIGTCGVVRQEILQGIRDDVMARRVLGFLDQTYYFPMNEPRTFDQAAEIYRGLRRRGITVRSPMDCLIAAVALHYEVILLHKDKDFIKIARHTKLNLYRF